MPGPSSHIPLAHVEAGLRSFNREMPEEHNRVLTDHCSELLFCPTQTAVDNLAREGITQGVHLVGDTMYDAVLQFAEIARQRSTILQDLGLKSKGYLLATIHRPYNTDVPENLRNILAAFAEIEEPIIFPIHPRTRQRIVEFGLSNVKRETWNVKLIEPVGYLDMLVLEQHARMILTDSGGMQKEAYFFGVPCVTLRLETEWVETVEAGWNVVVGANRVQIVRAVNRREWPQETPLAVIVIRPSRGWVSLRLHELWEYRELLYFLTWRDIKVRYKQTVLGAAWAIIQPFFTMVVFSLFFGKLAKVPSDEIPYPIFSYAALVPWTFFANGLSQSSTSLVASANLIKKVYFPRLVVPISAVISGGVDFVLAFLVLLGMMLFYDIVPTAAVVWLPLLLLLALVTALGVGLWLTAMNVQFRDVRYAVPFLVQAWMFATPIAYPSSLLDEPWRTLYGINPMAGVVEGFRWALLGTEAAPGPIIIVSALVAVGLLVSGAFYFRR